ncbi:MAG: segregation/condensation protein A [Patescibacteria group bacterium]|nr:segregation/condensation protein A [Patescibacteria group bacterium]
MYEIKLDQFSGPLDLLLKLIEEEKLDISKISLAKITDQFIDYLDKIKDVALHELADFLYLAAKLLYLKSIILLPHLTQEEEKEILKFEEQLKIYKEYQQATKIIKDILGHKRYSFSREKFFLNERLFIPPKKVGLKKIFTSFQLLIKNLEKELLIRKKIKRKIISLTDKIKEIDGILKLKRKFNFNFLMKKAKSKLEIIISFLAILELVKRQMIKVEQNKIFGEIKIYRR